jgi:hypothetical protein
MSEDVAHQKHYTGLKIEPIDYMRANFSEDMLRGFLLGNVIKYVSRYKLKDGIKDLDKAEVYLNWLKELENSIGAK